MPGITPPPARTTPGDDRDEEAYRALLPHIVAFSQAAVAAGWHETEIIAVMVGFALERAIEGAGTEGAEELLAAVRDRLRQAEV